MINMLENFSRINVMAKENIGLRMKIKFMKDNLIMDYLKDKEVLFVIMEVNIREVLHKD